MPVVIEGAAIALVEPVINTVACYFHEKPRQHGGWFASLHESAMLLRVTWKGV